MQSSANVGNHSPVFHLRTTRCLGITQFFVGIILAVLAGCEFSFSFYSYYYAQSGIFGTVLAFFTLFFSGMFGICSAKKPANVILNCCNMGMAITCSVLSVTQVAFNCLIQRDQSFYSWCTCYNYSYYEYESNCDCSGYVRLGSNVILLQTLTTLVELAICIGIIVVCFKNGCNKCCWNGYEATLENSAITQQVPYNPGYGLLAGENQAGTYGSIAPNSSRSTQHQQPVQGGGWPNGSVANQIQEREDAELFAKFQQFLSTANQLEPATRVRDQPRLHNVNPQYQSYLHHANPFMTQYQGPARINNPYGHQGQQITANAPFQSNVNMPAQITVARTVQNVMDIPPHLPETGDILQPTVAEEPLAASRCPSAIESEKFEEQQRLKADATHNRGPVRQDTPMPTEAPPAYEEEDKTSKTA